MFRRLIEWWYRRRAARGRRRLEEVYRRVFTESPNDIAPAAIAELLRELQRLDFWDAALCAEGAEALTWPASAWPILSEHLTWLAGKSATVDADTERVCRLLAVHRGEVERSVCR